MATAIQRRRGNTTQHANFTGLAGEITIDTDLNTIIVHDGVTEGGIRLAKYSEVESASEGDITAVNTLAGSGLTGGVTTGQANLAIDYENLTGNLVPSANNTYSLGSSSSVWKDLYVGANSIYIDGIALSVSGGSLQFDGNAVAVANNPSVTTDEITEGTTNLYFSNTLARSAISASGDLSYNSSTGVVSFTERTDAEVRGLISGGTGISYNSTTGAIAVDSTIATKDFANTAATNAVAAVIDSAPAALDTLNELANALGDDANFSTTITNSIALKYDAADFNTDWDTRLGTKDTGDLSEGTNLYFTAARARGNISAGGDLSYNASTGVMSFTERTDAEVRGLISASGDISYNSSTGVISFTERTDAEVRGLISASGDISYNSTTGVISFTNDAGDIEEVVAGNGLVGGGDGGSVTLNVAAGTGITVNPDNVAVNMSVFDTGDLAEGSNLYYTDSRARQAISVSGDLGYDSGTGVISFTERTDAEVRGLISAGGDLSYNSSTGVVSFTERTDAEVRGLVSGGTGIDYNSTTGVFSVDSTIATKDFANSAATTAVAAVIDSAPAALDTLNELANALGDDANFSTTITNSLALKYDAADFNTDWDTRLATKDTGDLSEGTNLYFTAARARGNISAGGDLSYNASTGVMSFTERTDAEVRGLISATGDVSYNDTTGVISFTERTDSEVRGLISAGGDLSYDSGTGVMSFTERTDAEVRGLISATGDISYNASTGVISFTNDAGDIEGVTAGNGLVGGGTTGTVTLNIGAGTGITVNADNVAVDMSAFSTTDLSEGTNLYFTAARARGNISAGGDLSYDSGTGVMSFTERTDAEVRGLISAGGDLSYNSSTGVMSYTTPTTIASLSNHDTGDLAEGTNLYFTAARARGNISAGGDLSYDSGTGVMSFTERTDAEVRGLISGGTGIDYNSTTGAISVDSTIATKDFANTAATNAVAAVIDSAPAALDTLNELANALGDDANFSTTVTNSLALKYDAADFDSDWDTRLATKDTGDLTEGTNLYFTAARARGNISASGDISYNSSTGVISFTERTDAEVRGLLSASGDLNYNNTTGVFSVTTYKSTDFDTDFSGKDTGDLTEGTNLYFTAARARGNISAGGDLSYNSSTGVMSFTERTDAEVRGLFSATGDISYNSSTGVFSFTNDAGDIESVTAGNGLVGGGTTGAVTLNVAGGTGITVNPDNVAVNMGAFTTSDLTEGTNLYFTAARARGNISATGDISYNASTGVISFTERTDAEVRGLISATGDISYNDTTGVISFTERTDAEVRGLISAGGDLSYNSSTGVMSFTERTDSEVRGLISVTDAGGDGSLAYNSGTGVITYTGPSASEVRAHFTGGTGVTITNGSIAIGQDVSTNANVSFNRVSGLAAPTAGDHAANKAYVDEVAEGLQAKPAVEIATTAELTGVTYNNGNAGVGATLTSNSNGAFPAIDGVTLTSTTFGENGVLVKDQSNAAHNGRYNLTQVGDGSNPWILTRCGLCDEADEIPGAYVFVKSGDTLAATGWVQVVDDPSTFTVGTDDINVEQFSGAGTYAAGDGLDLTGTTFSVNVSDGLAISGDNVILASSSAGTGITYSSGVLNIGQAVGTGDNVTFNNITSSGVFAGSGASLSSLNASNISSGTLANARLPDLVVADFAAAAIQTGAESFVDSDTVLMTAAAVQDKILSYGYTTNTGDITGVTAGSGLSGGGASGSVTLNIGAGTGITVNPDNVAVNIGAFDTDDLAEGSANLYYTDARARAAISATGSVDYNSTTGVISFTERTDSEVRGLFSATGDISYNASTGVFSFTNDAGDIESVTAGNGLIGGGTTGAVTLNIGAGTGITVNPDNVAVNIGAFDTDDLAEGSANLYYTTTRANSAIDARVTKTFVDNLNVDADTLDGNDSTYFANASNLSSGQLSSSLLPDIVVTDFAGSAIQTSAEGFSDSDSVLMTAAAIEDRILSKGYTTNVGDITGVTAGNGLTDGGTSGTVTLNIGSGTGITVNPDNVAVNMSAFSTTDLSEGTNLYFTAARVRGNISATGDIDYNATTGVISFTERTDAEVRGLVSGGTGIDYNASTGVFTVDSTIATKDYANTAATNAVAAVIDSAPAALDTLNELANALGDDANFSTTVTNSLALKYDAADFNTDWDTRLGTKDTGDLAEGANLYFTAARVRGNISVDGDLGYDQANGIISFTERTDAEVRGLFSATGDISYNSSTGVFSFTDTGIDGVTAGNGLIGGGSSGTVTVHVVGGTGITVNPDNVAVNMGVFDTDDLAEGSANLYYTTARANSAIDARVNQAFVNALNVDAETLDGLDSTYFANASNLSSGELSSSLLPDLVVADFAAAAIQTGAESFVDSDTVLMTAAAVQDKILSYGYTTNTGDINGVTAGNGLVGGGTSGTVAVHVGAGTGITVTADNVSVNMGAFNTDDLAEGSANLYYTTARANSAIDARVNQAFVNALNVDADTLDGLDSTYFANASNLTSGELSSTLLPELVVGDFADAAIQTSAEGFSDSDTVLMTAAAIEDRILSKGYTTNVGDITGVTAGNGLTDGGTSGTVTLNIGQGAYMTINPGNIAVDATSANTGNKVVARDADGSFAANVITATATQARYADVAERYEADGVIEPGTVVVFGGEKEITACSSEAHHAVAGVISTAPAYLMNESAGDDQTHPPVALTGRVPCKVVGPVAKGDLMVTSEVAGHAKADNNAAPGRILGKAIESSEGGEAVIEVLVTLM